MRRSNGLLFWPVIAIVLSLDVVTRPGFVGVRALWRAQEIEHAVKADS